MMETIFLPLNKLPKIILCSSKPFIIKTSNHIKVSSGSQFSFFTHINDQWFENHQQFTEEKADGLFMFEDSNNRIHIVYKGLHEGQTIMLERIEQDGVWSDYYPIFPYRSDHYYAADGYENLMATAWEGRGYIYVICRFFKCVVWSCY
jgi:hypothetical protein